MIKAIIFDFDGVVVDSEPLHLKVFQQVLGDEGIDLTKELYTSKYLAYDDKTFFIRSLSDFGKYENTNQVDYLIDKKSEIFEALIEEKIKVFAGVSDFLDKINGEYPVAIGSGALRSEIEIILEKKGLQKYFDFIVSADEVEHCKPNPEVYLKVLSEFNNHNKVKLNAVECLVFEDAVHGIQAAKAAGMKCVGISNSYEKNELNEADFVIESFEDIDVDFLNKFN